MHYFLEGSIKEISETQTFGEKFKKREFVVKVEDGSYPEFVKFELVNDDVENLDRFIVGEVVTIAFIIKGNEYNGKYYVNLRAIAIGEVIDDMAEKEFQKSKKNNKKLQKELEESIKN
jgi:hypothetical protein